MKYIFLCLLLLSATSCNCLRLNTHAGFKIEVSPPAQPKVVVPCQQ